jgi:outer membrane receptor for ferrienterochelin and colicins
MNNFFSLLFILFSISATAHEYDIGTIIVNGSLDSEVPLSRINKDSVVKKEVITKSQITHKNATSLAKAVDLEPGVQTTLTCANCGSQRITLNGLRGENTTVLIDGIPAFSSVSSFYGMEAIPMVGVERIEIMRGAGASLTAPEAIGGAINIVTVIPNQNKFSYQIRGGTHQYLNQEILGSYGDLEGGTLIGAQSNLMGSFDEDNNNVAESSRQSQKSVFIKKENRLGDKLKVSARIGYQELELLGGTTKAYRPTTYPASTETLDDFGSDRDVRNKFTGNLSKIGDRIRLNRVDGGGSVSYHLTGDTNLKGSFAIAKQNQKSIYSHGYDYNNEDMFRFFDLKLNSVMNESHFVTVGVDHRNEDMCSSSDYLYKMSGYKSDSFKFTTAGAYIQDEWYISDKDELNLILRIDHMNVEWADKRLLHSELDKTAFAPRVHYKRIHNQTYSSRFSYGVGYRAPLSMFESQHGTNEEGFELNITKLEHAHNFTYTLNREDEISSSAVSFAWTKLSHMAYADEETSPVLFKNSDEVMNIKTFGILHLQKITPDWSLESSFDWFIMPENYKERLPTASQETRARLTSDYHFGKNEFVATVNVVGSRKLSAYGYNKNYNTLADDPDPMSFDKIPANQKRQKAPAFYTLDLFYQREFSKFTFLAGINNLLDYTQTKKAESPLAWRTHGNHAHLDNRHVWGPNVGRVLYTGLKIEI